MTEEEKKLCWEKQQVVFFSDFCEKNTVMDQKSLRITVKSCEYFRRSSFDAIALKMITFCFEFPDCFSASILKTFIS